tara:strand:- start:258 stop:413 length:156 start_codon:yes stop_codon:yes gene_type:complete
MRMGVRREEGGREERVEERASCLGSLSHTFLLLPPHSLNSFFLLGSCLNFL